MNRPTDPIAVPRWLLDKMRAFVKQWYDAGSDCECEYGHHCGYEKLTEMQHEFEAFVPGLALEPAAILPTPPPQPRLRHESGAPIKLCIHCAYPNGIHLEACPAPAVEPGELLCTLHHVRECGVCPFCGTRAVVPASSRPDQLLLSQAARLLRDYEGDAHAEDVQDVTRWLAVYDSRFPATKAPIDPATCTHLWKVEGVRNPSPDQLCEKGCGTTWAQRTAEEEAVQCVWRDGCRLAGVCSSQGFCQGGMEMQSVTKDGS